MLQDYPKDLRDTLITGLKHGFQLHHEDSTSVTVGTRTRRKPDQHTPNLLSQANIRLSQNNSDITIMFAKCKHSNASTPFQLAISSNQDSQSLFSNLTHYLALRGSSPGPLFLLNNKPVTSQYFTQQLTKCLQSSGYETSKYKLHSFRIGSATTAIQQGCTHEQVQQMGRWRSGAFKRYIRVQSFTV